MTAIIRLTSGNHEIREKSIKLCTIFGDVYVAKRFVKYIEDDVIEVPNWIFQRNGLNACQMVAGFIR